jgi:hypothetical protein
MCRSEQMPDMEIVAKGRLLELVPRKDRAEVILGGILGIFAIVFILSVHSVLNQKWSYRFGAISTGGRLTGALFAVIFGLFCLTGAVYNVMKKTIYRFDLCSGIFMFGEYLFSTDNLRICRLADITGIISSKDLIAPGVERYRLGVALASGEKVFFDECFTDRATVERIQAAITTATGLKEVP